MHAIYLVLDMDAAVERMGDREISVEVAHCFADNLPNALESLQAALARADMEAATRLSHSLKGNCGTVGAEELRRDCLLLEQTCRAEDAEKALALFGDLSPKLLALREVLAGV